MANEEVAKDLEAAERLMARGDCRGALSKYNRVLRADPANAAASFGKAEAGATDPSLKMNAGEIIALYEKAIAADGMNTMYHSRLALFCIETGQYDRAEAAFLRAAQSDSENAPYYLCDLAAEYYVHATRALDDEAPNQELDGIRSRALGYFLRVIDTSPEDAARLLGKK